MIKAQIISDSPILTAKINTHPSILSARIEADAAKLYARLTPNDQTILGRIIKPVSKEPEPYYEVSNEYGTTIVIGD